MTYKPTKAEIEAAALAIAEANYIASKEDVKARYRLSKNIYDKAAEMALIRAYEERQKCDDIQKESQQD